MKSIQLKYVPFFKHNDPTRMQMASSHIRQAVFVRAEVPKVIPKDVPKILVEPYIIKGKIVHSTYDGVFVERPDGSLDFVKFQSMMYESYIPYQIGDDFAQSEAISEEGIPLLGCNLLTVVAPFKGYNYEDAIVISESAAKKLSHLSWDKTTVKLQDGWSLIAVTDEVDEFGIPRYDIPFVRAGDPYVIIVKERLIHLKKLIAEFDSYLLWDFAIKRNTIIPEFDAFIRKWHSLPLKNQRLTLRALRRLVRKVDYDILAIRIWRSDAEVGDKLANRHGNKGVIGIVVPDNEMPQTPYGPAEVVINPLGIISRMNLGQLFEIHLTKLIRDAEEQQNSEVLQALEKLVGYGQKSYVYDTITWSDMKELFRKLNKRPVDRVLFDGTEREVTCGWCYWLKLHHLAKSKYSVRQFDGERKGQRFGEMETWTLLGYDAEHVLFDMFRYLSDSPMKMKLFSQLLGIGVNIPKQSKSTPALKFESMMKVLGIDIDKAYKALQEKKRG